MKDRKEGRWALVLGCSAGTGASIARALARENKLHVIGFHRGNFPEGAQALKAEIEGQDLRCEIVQADAGRIDELPTLVDRVAEILDGDKLKVMVHSLASASVGATVSDEPRWALHPKQIRKTFEVMAHSFMYWGQYAYERDLFGADAQIVGLLNYLERAVCAGGAAIGASKAAMAAYMKFMAAEYAPLGIRVNAIRFGAADTAAARHVPDFPAALAEFKSINPMGRNVTTEDVADMVSLLLDRRAGFVNGAIVAVDGGEERSFIQHIFDGGRKA
jgi:NAD(P)-dependent dehydrogenase (short-subunit alcohol dehydrogenase family)